MLGLGWLGPLKGLAAILCALGVISLALIYFIPTPPSKIAPPVLKGPPRLLLPPVFGGVSRPK